MPCFSFEEEFWSLKHLNSPSEAAEQREKVSSSTENMLAVACVGFGTESGRAIYVNKKRHRNTGGGKRECAVNSQGWQDLKVIFFWSHF
jgi:hypothetical protein